MCLHMQSMLHMHLGHLTGSPACPWRQQSQKGPRPTSFATTTCSACSIKDTTTACTHFCSGVQLRKTHNEVFESSENCLS